MTLVLWWRPPDAEFPTDTRVRFAVALRSDAHVYIYQVAVDGTVSPLFPDARIAIHNPVSASTPLTVPPAPASFRLDAKDIGVEEVHVVASVGPVATVDAAIASLASDPTSVTRDELDCATRGLAYDSEQSCPGSRGLVFEPGSDGGAEPVSVSAVNVAADDTVHVVYRFRHTPASP